MQNKLKEYREKVGMSQQKLSELTGISRNTISKLENGHTAGLNTSTMVKLCKALGEKPDVIFLL